MLSTELAHNEQWALKKYNIRAVLYNIWSRMNEII